MTNEELHEMVRRDYAELLRDLAELDTNDFDATSLPPVPLVLALSLQEQRPWTDCLDALLQWRINPRRASSVQRYNTFWFIKLAAVKLLGLSFPPLD